MSAISARDCPLYPALCFKAAMASYRLLLKDQVPLLSRKGRNILARLLMNSSPNLCLPRSALTSCAAVFGRPYSNVANSTPMDLPVFENPPHQTHRVSDNMTSTPPLSLASSLKATELAKFSAIAETWWDAEGPFKPLHVMNPTRLAFIRSTLCRHFSKDPNSPKPLEGLKIIDVGCGGGILSEPLARMGATVTAIDAVEKNIIIARLHADLDPVTSAIEYQCTTAEKMVEEQRKFDVVVSLEVIEHVADPAQFCQSLASLTVPGGATLISTINRSMRAYATAIVAAEYVLQWLPKGTHQWSSFLTPEELTLILQRASISVQEMAGFLYNPLTGRWYLSEDIGVNFIVFGTKYPEIVESTM